MSADPSLLSVSSAGAGSAYWGPSSRLTDGSRALVTKPSYTTIAHEEPSEGGGITFPELDGREPAEQLEVLKDMLEKTTNLKDGAANMLKMEMPVCILS